MEITLVMVCSVDGIIARDTEDSPFLWNSKEDKQHFVKVTKEIGAVLMGSATYLASGLKTYKDRIGFVATSNPDKLSLGENMYSVKGTPEEIVNVISAKGIEKLALIGGSNLNAQFLKAGLVNKICLTVEPIIFGEGIRLANLPLETQMQLESSIVLNDKGTLLNIYEMNY